MTRRLRAVQVGAGSFCEQFHAPVLQRLAEEPDSRISLEAICDLRLERARLFSGRFGYARVYEDFLWMVEEIKPDLIYCMVQPAATAGVLEKLLPLGIPVFTEKPPGVTVAQADKLAALARGYNVVNLVAFNRRAIPEIQRMHEWTRATGPIRYARADMFRNRRLEPHFAVETAIHALDCLRFLCGAVTGIESRCTSYSGSAARDYHVRLFFSSGSMADLTVLVDSGLTREQYLLQVQNQAMEVTLGASYASPFCNSGLKFYRGNQLMEDAPASADVLVAGGFVNEHILFLDAVTSGQPPACDLQDARDSLRLAVAVDQLYSGPMDSFLPRASE
jgi:myo-inositol 2-dehydrogenase/D-chiro-inositol 1-dehydrogenase